jgi:Protein of unknown function (DUF1579)
MKNAFILILLIFNWTSMTAQTNDPWAEYMTPSDVHSVFAQYVGSFTMEITMSMGEGKQPAIITLASENNLLLGGRFLEMKQHGKMMGMDYQSITTIGFNNTDKKFALTTITNMGTGTLSLFGNWDHPTKSGNLFGQLTNPVSKEIINVRQTVTFIDKDSILIESFDQEGNKPEEKTVQYKLTRI